jgi:hypothetical protein
MCPPALAHYYIDNAWRDLGERTGQIRYMPDVIVRHHHPAGSGGRAGWLWDQTYEDAQATWSTGLDHVAYQAWRGDALDAAAARIRALAGAR